MNNKINFYQLVQKRLSDSISDEEKAELLDALSDPENVRTLSGIIEEWYQQKAPDNFVYDETKLREMIHYVLSVDKKTLMIVPEEESADTIETDESGSAENNKAKISRLTFRWMRYAAAVVLCIGAGLIYYNIKKTDSSPPTTAVIPVPEIIDNDVLPGSNKAVLTLSDGTKVELKDQGGQVISDGKLAIRVKDGALAYSKTDVVVYNTMTTPKGGQYKLKLPDGSVVWLNASSSITYPTAFPGNTREVTITGEAYFEVAKNPAKPFTVKTYKDEITVKGTSFNVNSYDDEDGIKTSLLEGSVQINNSLLTPGNAYINGEIIKTDLTKDLAWKNGVFNFHNTKLSEAMRQIARWYDVDVKYEGNVDRIELGGEIGRNLTLQQVLKGLQDKDLHFRLEGKTLTVY